MLKGARRVGSVMLTSGAGKTHRPRACCPAAGGVARWNALKDVIASGPPGIAETRAHIQHACPAASLCRATALRDEFADRAPSYQA
jgi:hypothetical protein